MTTLHLSWLRSFVASERHGQLKAAESLGIKPSTVSKHVSDLSEWLRGPSLFEGRPWQLTEHGKAFLPVARAAITQLESVLSTLEERRGNIETAVPISTTSKISPGDIKLT